MSGEGYSREGESPAGAASGGTIEFNSEEFASLPIGSRALIFAAWMHRGQERRFGGREYIWHPLEVAARLESLGAGEVALAAAFLHDTVEQTEATLEDIHRLFGGRLGECVSELTNPDMPDRSRREEHLVEAVSAMSLPALQVKLADRLQNLLESHHAPADHRLRWIRETHAMLEAVPAGHRTDRAVAKLVKLLDGFMNAFRESGVE